MFDPPGSLRYGAGPLRGPLSAEAGQIPRDSRPMNRRLGPRGFESGTRQLLTVTRGRRGYGFSGAMDGARRQDRPPGRIAKAQQKLGACTAASIRYKYGTHMPQAMNEILTTTLRSLEELAGQKLASGDFAELARIATAANIVRSLLVNGVSADATDDSFRLSIAEAAAIRPRAVRSTRKVPHKKRRRRGYPRFYKDDERLVKVGWSPKKQKSYEHRASKSAVFAVLDGIRSRLEKRRTFKVEDVGALPCDPDASDLPQYVVYLVVAWLEHQRLLAKHGRNGYSLHGRVLSQRSNDQLWESIPINPSDGSVS